MTINWPGGGQVNNWLSCLWIFNVAFTIQHFPREIVSHPTSLFSRLSIVQLLQAHRKCGPVSWSYLREETQCTEVTFISSVKTIQQIFVKWQKQILPTAVKASFFSYLVQLVSLSNRKLHFFSTWCNLLYLACKLPLCVIHVLYMCICCFTVGARACLHCLRVYTAVS